MIYHNYYWKKMKYQENMYKGRIKNWVHTRFYLSPTFKVHNHYPKQNLNNSPDIPKKLPDSGVQLIHWENLLRSPFV